MRLEIGMSQFNNTLDRWSKSDKKIARELFELAKKRDYEDLLKLIQLKSQNLTTPQSIWDLKDFLNFKAKEFDQKYDYRYSILDDVFAKLILENLLNLNDLKLLSKEKQEQIKNILNILWKLS